MSIFFVAMLMASRSASAKIIIPSQEAHKIVTTDRLKAQVSFLSDTLCEGRASGSKGNVEAGMWIVDRFRKAGLKPFGGSWAKTFRADNGTICRNLIGMLPGKDSGCDSYIIVMAHYDGLGILEGKMYPGADSNASGVAAMIDVMQMFVKMRELKKTYQKNIIFVGMDATGLSLQGSDTFWRMIEAGLLRDPVSGRPITKDKIATVVNIDRIGSTMSPIREGHPKFMLMLGRDNVKDVDMSVLATSNLKYRFNMDLAYDYYGSKDFTKLFYNKISDQRKFVESGVPSVMFTSGITMNSNKVTDTVDSLDLEILRERIILIFHWIEKAA